MAYIYRYQLRDANLRDSIFLKEHTEIIDSSLKDYFNNNLKDSFVEDRYFEFKLYATVSSGLLKSMGRKLKSILNIDSEKYGFVRMEQTLYVLIHSPQEYLEDNTNDKIIHIEFIDSMLLESNNQFMKRANMFFEKSKGENITIGNGDTKNFEGVIKNYYVDVLEAYVDNDSIPEMLRSGDEESCFFIKSYHRHRTRDQSFDEKYQNNNMIRIEKCFDVGYVENRKSIKRQELNEKSHLDYLKIFSAERQTVEIIKKIENELKLFLETATDISALRDLCNNNANESQQEYTFRVHNVGQALATSLSYGDAPPFLYFDYGMPFGANSFTKPSKINMRTNVGATIIISHIHKDHWFRISDDFNAYKCHWIIPDQPIGKLLKHTLAEIIVTGGSVQFIKSEIAFCGGKLTCGGVLKIDSTRRAKHVHETGLTLRIEAHNDKGEDLNILIAGDQRYDYVDQDLLGDLDILVASHHGGKFCWSKIGIVPAPKNSNTSVLIYSYGLSNTHKHPSQVTDYNNENWHQSHHTFRDGEFEISIFCK